MRILLVANYLPDFQQSMQRFATLLQEGLIKAGHEVRVIRPSVKAGRLVSHAAFGKWLGYIDKLVLFPKALAQAVNWADITHICDHSNAFYIKYIERRPHVVTCHDLLAIRMALGEIPQQSTKWSGRKLQQIILSGLIRARNIVCDSDATMADVLRIAAQQNGNVCRIYLGLDQFKPVEGDETASHLREFGLSPGQKFILHVGGNQWYKNRSGVIRIFARVRQQKTYENLFLVMAGKPMTVEMRQLVKQCGIESSVLELTNVSDRTLRALYSCAELLLFPSLQEGFGWPIAEAQACGCPVVTSNIAPMTEVGGSAATYLDPLNEISAASVTAKLIGSRNVLREANSANSKRFNTDRMIAQYVSLYARILKQDEASASLLSEKPALGFVSADSRLQDCSSKFNA